MNFFTVLSDVIDDPRGFLSRTGPGGFGWAGFAGYLVGLFSVFVFLRMFSAVPPGIFSFGNVFLFALAGNFLLAAFMHLFLAMTGAEGDALKLFQAFGLTELFWSLLIPLGFLAKLNFLTPLSGCLLCLCVVLLARISLARRLYTISRGKALLALTLPYAAAMCGFFMAFVYLMVYAVWLMQ